jgi:hypothetical protein
LAVFLETYKIGHLFFKVVTLGTIQGGYITVQGIDDLLIQLLNFTLSNLIALMEKDMNLLDFAG